MSDGLSEIRTILADAAAHEANCEALRAVYGKTATGRAVVCLSDYVENDAARVVSEIAAATNRRCRELVLLIDSPGGHSDKGFAISEAVSSFKGRTIGVVVGRCSSAATFALAACRERVAPATAEFLIHSCGFYREDNRYHYDPRRWTAQTHAQRSASMLGIDQKIADLYLKATGSRELRDMVFAGGDFRLSAAVARKNNLLTRIEPASDYVKPGFYLSAYYRPNMARANVALANIARASRNSGAPFVSLRIRGEIGKTSGTRAADVRKQLAAAPHANTILAHFDSIGGNVAEAFDMAAAILEHSAAKKKAVITGQCLSAAVVPLLAFDLRTANQKSEIMIHRNEVVPKPRGDRRWTAAALSDAAQTADLADNETLDFLASRTGYDREFFAQEMKTEKSMRLIDALKCGLVHEIAGVTQPCSAEWPDLAKAMFDAGAVMGLPSHKMTEKFMTACRSAIGGRNVG